MGDPSAPGEDVERELQRLLVDVLAEILEPLEARLRRPLRRHDDRLALRFVRLERERDALLLVEARRERERVLHRELGAGADREMRGVRSIPEDHHVAVMPTLIAHGGEADPFRVVRVHRVTPEDLRKEPADLGDTGDVALAGIEWPARERVEPGAVPDRIVHLDDERAARRVIRVAVYLHDAVRCLDDVELEGVEDEIRPEPHELAAAHVERRTERVRVCGSSGGVNAVGADHEVVRSCELANGWRLGVEAEHDPELATALMQNLEKPLAAHRRKTVTAGRDHLSAVVDVDVIPARELAGHRLVNRRVGVLDAAQRLIREHHAEPEGVVVSVALPHGDLMARVELLGERREVQSARPAPDNRNLHLSLGATVKCGTL